MFDIEKIILSLILVSLFKKEWKALTHLSIKQGGISTPL